MKHFPNHTILAHQRKRDRVRRKFEEFDACARKIFVLPEATQDFDPVEIVDESRKIITISREHGTFIIELELLDQAACVTAAMAFENNNGSISTLFYCDTHDRKTLAVTAENTPQHVIGLSNAILETIVDYFCGQSPSSYDQRRTIRRVHHR